MGSYKKVYMVATLENFTLKGNGLKLIFSTAENQMANALQSVHFTLNVPTMAGILYKDDGDKVEQVIGQLNLESMTIKSDRSGKIVFTAEKKNLQIPYEILSALTDKNFMLSLVTEEEESE